MVTRILVAVLLIVCAPSCAFLSSLFGSRSEKLCDPDDFPTKYEFLPGNLVAKLGDDAFSSPLITSERFASYLFDKTTLADTTIPYNKVCESDYKKDYSITLSAVSDDENFTASLNTLKSVKMTLIGEKHTLKSGSVAIRDLLSFMNLQGLKDLKAQFSNGTMPVMVVESDVYDTAELVFTWGKSVDANVGSKILKFLNRQGSVEYVSSKQTKIRYEDHRPKVISTVPVSLKEVDELIQHFNDTLPYIANGNRVAFPSGGYAVEITMQSSSGRPNADIYFGFNTAGMLDESGAAVISPRHVHVKNAIKKYTFVCLPTTQSHYLDFFDLHATEGLPPNNQFDDNPIVLNLTNNRTSAAINWNGIVIVEIKWYRWTP